MGGQLYDHFRRNKKRRKRYGVDDRRGQLPYRLCTEQRAEIVEQPQRIGDWEVDIIIGKRHQQAIVTLIERKSCIALLQKVEQKTTKHVRNALIDMRKSFRTACITSPLIMVRNLRNMSRLLKSRKLVSFLLILMLP